MPKPRGRTREMFALRKTLLLEYSTLSTKSYWNIEIDREVFSLLKKRMSTVGIRSYFVYKVYRYVAGQASKEGIRLREDFPLHLFEVQLPFIAEALITNAYYHNQILDRKSGTTTPHRINANLNAGNLLHAFIKHYARALFRSENDLNQIVLPRIERIFECVDLAQYMDKNWGNYEQFKEDLPIHTRLSSYFENLFQYADFAALEAKIIEAGLPLEQAPFTQLYLKRCFLGNAPLFILMAEIVIELMGYDGKEREKILRFAGNYGLLVQLVNDINDFIPEKTVDKTEKDAFADLKNGTISFPLIMFFASRPKCQFNVMQELLKRSQKKVFNILLPTVTQCCIPISEWFAYRLDNFLAIDNSEYKLLSDMASLGYDNKYYHYYKNEYEVYLKSKKKKEP